MDKVSRSVARHERRAKKRNQRAERQQARIQAQPQEEEPTKAPVRPSTEPVTPKTTAQRRYDQAIKNSQITYGIGPAGTGKTFLATCRAADALRDGLIDKLILTRPAVEAAGERLGFLPGTLEEKYAPYLEPFFDALEYRLGSGHLKWCLRNKVIDPRPLGFMRGCSFKNAWVLADEMQNATKAQMEMLLTRIGEGTKFIVSGDLRQSDLLGTSGLGDAVERFKGVEGISTVVFGKEDIVRSGMCRIIVERYAED